MRVLTSGIIAVGCICSASASLNLPCGTVLTPEDKGYSNATYIDNGGAGRERLPSLVVMAECAEDVPVALKYAKSNNISFSVKGGGHSAAGYSLVRDGITVDMSLMNASRIETDAATGDSILWVQAGATFGHVYSRLNDTGLILAGGGCSTVGVSGFMLGGGLSFLSRAFGLGVDNVVSLRMVTVDGELITVSDQNETLADLWWALRGGGGGNFGVVIDMEIKLHPGEDATTSADVCWKGSEASIAALKQYSRWLESDSPWPGTAHPNVGAPALLIRDSNHSGGAPYPIDFCVTLFALGDVNVSSEVESLIRFVNSSVPAVIQTDGCAGPTATFYEWESRCGALKTGVDGDFGYMTSGVFGIGAMSDGDAASKLVNGLAVTPGDRTIINFHDGGGEIRNASKGGSFAHRDFNLIYQIKGIWVEESRSEENFEWGKALQASLAPYISGAYVNYIDPWLQEWQTAYYGSNYDKLVSIKKTVDPDNFFHFNQSLGANSTPSPTPAPSASCRCRRRSRLGSSSTASPRRTT